jgi:multidrug efflux system membrane fusion protein
MGDENRIQNSEFRMRAVGQVSWPVWLAVAALWSGCGSSASNPKAATEPVPDGGRSVTVDVVIIHSQPWPEVYEATGTVRARAAAVLSSKVLAYVRQVAVQVGDRVREGQLLVVLESQDLDANVRRAEAAQSEVKNSIPEAESGIAGAKANLDLAAATFRRMEDLASKKSISDQEFDEASAHLKAAQAAYDMARAKRTQLDSKLTQVEQEIAAAKIMRGYTQIPAPFAGVVTAKSVELGNLAAPGAPLLTLERDGSYRLEAAVEESKLSLVKAGQITEVELEALGRRLSARVSEIVPAVDAASRAYLVKIDLPAVENLRSGMFGRARFQMGTRSIVAIPKAALVDRGQLQSVFVVEEAHAHTRLVTTGKRGLDSVELLSGLSEGEKVISPAPAGLVDGARVEIRQ